MPDKENNLPALTRWSFEDFKLMYDSKFGRKSKKDHADSDSTLHVKANGYTKNAETNNGNANGHAKITDYRNGNTNGTREMAIYEKFMNQSNGGIPNVVANGGSDKMLVSPYLPTDIDGERESDEGGCNEKGWEGGRLGGTIILGFREDYIDGHEGHIQPMQRSPGARLLSPLDGHEDHI